MEESLLQRCQELTDHSFKDRDLLDLALTHASVAPTRLDSNERLEFLGDAVLGFVVVHDLYERQEELLEGDLTKIKSAVVSRQTCAVVAEETGIAELLRLGKGMQDRNGMPTSVCAAVFESLIGAIYLDGGLEPAREFILRSLESHITEAISDAHQNNFKSCLQQFVQRKWGTTPAYLLLDEKGPDHDKCFEVAVVVNGQYFPSAWGRSKKEAEQDAARLAMQELGQIDTEAEGEGGETPTE